MTLKANVAPSTTLYISPLAAVAIPVNSTSHFPLESPYFTSSVPIVGYQGSTVLDEPEREAGTTSIPIPQREESENIPLPDLPGQLENVQQSGNEIAERGMPT